MSRRGEGIFTLAYGACRLVISTDPLEEKPGDIMLNPEVVEFASGALAALGGHYTGEIQFSGKSARVARRMSQRGTRDQVRATLADLRCLDALSRGPVVLVSCKY